MNTTLLYRPVGAKELALIRAGHYRRFPPRQAHQANFCPLVDRRYAEQVARDQTSKDAQADFAGYVTRFAVKTEFLSAYQIHRVGAANALEYRIPANELESFNDAIVGPIAVVAEFHGKASGSR